MSLKRALTLAFAAAASVVASPINENRVSSFVDRRGNGDDVAPDSPCFEGRNGHSLQQLTWFGERPSYRRDGLKIAFMSKSYGDAMEIDLRSQRITLLTGWQHAGFLRVQYLPNGDLFLIGAREFEDISETRDKNMEMWVLHPGDKFVKPLNHKIFEGVAISILSNKIAWANTHGQFPDEIVEGESIIYTADIDYSSGEPVLINKKEVIRDMGPECILEPQDFWKNDTALTFSCYSTDPEFDYAWVESVDLETGERTMLRDVPQEYNEIEGIDPFERFTLVESDVSPKANGSESVVGTEIYRMGLAPGEKEWERLTWFSTTYPWKAGNPVISPDGLTMAVHSSRSDQPAGVGYGLFVVDM